MPLTANQIQASILERTGDFDPTTGDPVVGGGGYLEQQIAGVWAQYADKAYIAPRLQELYTERDLLDRYITVLQRDYDLSGDGSSFSRGQPVRTLMSRRDKVASDITQVESAAAAARAPAVGQLVATAPVNPPFGGTLDANGPMYGGSPYWRRPWGYP